MKNNFFMAGRRILCGVLASTMMVSACACNRLSNNAVCLSNSIKPKSGISGSKLDDAFVNGAANFSLNIFRDNVRDGENSVISPLSVMLALSMTANGAKGETLSQMEKALGGNDIDSLNKYLYTYIRSLPESEKAKLISANSIWIKDDGSVDVKKDFLQKNADYYASDVYKAPFDENTLNDINKWVSINTDNQINSILNNIDSSAVIYLLNAITFDAEWATVYEESQIKNGEFYGTNGTNRVYMMHSSERRYLEDDNAVGFMKYYDQGYSYAVLMPNEGVSLKEYVASLSGESFVNMLKNAEQCDVIATMPKFKSDYSVDMCNVLRAMGMNNAFDLDSADFSGINGKNDLYIGKVMHKSVINVDEKGTKAGAATAVAMLTKAAMPDDEAMPKTVTVDRPFIYAIVEDETNLPIFIGAVSNL